MSLKYTLKAVDDVTKQHKPSFQKEMSSLFDSVVTNSNYNKTIHEKSYKVTASIEKLLNEVLTEYQLLDPFNIINRIL